ncbi:hypothetical protein V8F33_010940 [Rhypophila sp. PSN 637]
MGDMTGGFLLLVQLSWLPVQRHSEYSTVHIDSLLLLLLLLLLTTVRGFILPQRQFAQSKQSIWSPVLSGGCLISALVATANCCLSNNNRKYNMVSIYVAGGPGPGLSDIIFPLDYPDFFNPYLDKFPTSFCPLLENSILSPIHLSRFRAANNFPST